MAETCSQISCCLPNSFANPIEPDTGDFVVELRLNIEDSGTLTGSGPHEQLSSVTIEAVAESGFEFVSWTDVNGFVISESEDFTFSITQNMILIAVFIAS